MKTFCGSRARSSSLARLGRLDQFLPQARETGVSIERTPRVYLYSGLRAGPQDDSVHFEDAQKR